MIDDPDSQRWYRKAVIYCVDVDSYSDSDGDGWGDFQGLRPGCRTSPGSASRACG